MAKFNVHLVTLGASVYVVGQAYHTAGRCQHVSVCHDTVWHLQQAYGTRSWPYHSTYGEWTRIL